ncbi:hypothetical protein EHQ42_15810, partial [Leptospira levettii]|uniref:hypothetical protein n=1 Tax=Leptospira levettii TaxID=2023178 RepID=UPI0010827AAB
MFQLSKEELEKFLYKTQKDLNDKVFNNVYNFLRENPKERKTLNPAFPFPQKVRLGLLDNYFAVEYIGPNKDDEDDIETTLLYDPRIGLYEFLEIDLSHLSLNKIPYSESFENMNMFFGESIDYLTDYFYDFTQWKENFSLNGLID